MQPLSLSQQCERDRGCSEDREEKALLDGAAAEFVQHGRDGRLAQ